MVKQFLDYIALEKRRSPLTLRAYSADLAQFHLFLTAYHGSDANPQQASFHDIRAWLSDLNQSGVQARSINRKLASLRSYYAFLVQRQIISINPTLKIKSLKTPERLPKFVSQADMEQVFTTSKEGKPSTLGEWRELLVPELLYGTGMRLSELINLTFKDIDLDVKQLRVLGKRNKPRVIPLTAHLAQYLQEYALWRTANPATQPYIILTDAGLQAYPMLIQRLVKAKLLLTHTSKKTPHVLRHTFATHLLHAGAELNGIKEVLGHSSLAATQVYTHNSMEQLKLAHALHPRSKRD